MTAQKKDFIEILFEFREKKPFEAHKKINAKPVQLLREVFLLNNVL